jgi:hypothetical protein
MRIMFMFASTADCSRSRSSSPGLMRDEQRVGRDPVGAAAEDLTAVDLEREAAAGLVRIGNQLDCAQADLAGTTVSVGVSTRDVIKSPARRMPRWPPERWLLDLEDMHEVAFRRR